MRVSSVGHLKKAVVENGEIMRKRITNFVSCLILFSVSASTHAAESRMDSADLFDSILQQFHDTAHTWGHTLFNYAGWLFWCLATISMVVTFGFMALRKADLQEFASEAIRFIMVLGFFYFLLENGSAIATSIIDSLRELASQASGVPAYLSPSGIVDVGFDIAFKAVDNSSIWSPAATTVGLVIAAAILIIFILVGINLLLILVSGWFLTYAGIFLLGFGGGRWTQEIAINYFKTILGIALQAFAMVLLIGIGKSFVDQYYALMSKDILLKEMFIMLAVAVILLTLINEVPSKLAGIIQGGMGGGPGGSGGGMGLGGAMATLGVAGAAVTAGASLAGAQAAGGAKALNAAFKAAAQSVGSSSGDVSSGASSTSKLGGLASAMGQAGKTAGQFMGSFGSHLASGAASVVQQQAGSMKGAVSDKASETFGGKIAEAIAQRSENSKAQSSSSHATTSTETTANEQGITNTPQQQDSETTPSQIENHPSSVSSTTGTTTEGSTITQANTVMPESIDNTNVAPMVAEGSLSAGKELPESLQEEVDAFVNKSSGE